jgi:hypothetical protein
VPSVRLFIILQPIPSIDTILAVPHYWPISMALHQRKQMSQPMLSSKSLTQQHCGMSMVLTRRSYPLRATSLERISMS